MIQHISQHRIGTIFHHSIVCMCFVKKNLSCLHGVIGSTIARQQQTSISLTHREAHVCQLFDETIHYPGIFWLPWYFTLKYTMT